MAKNNSFIKEIKQIYRSIKPQIISRLNEFEKLWKYGSEQDIFAELVFCLLTPQSKAKSCFAAVLDFTQNDLLLNGNFKDLSSRLNCVRFKNNKARYIIGARKQFLNGGRSSLRSSIKRFRRSTDAREWFVKNVKGLGYKESSHFLRNIGMGRDIAILDRHILKNLKMSGCIKHIPKSIPRRVYLDIEDKMIKLSKDIKIPLDHLDFVFWYKETGDVFK